MLIQGQDFVSYIYSIMLNVLSIHIQYKDGGWEWGVMRKQLHIIQRPTDEETK